MSRHPEVEAIVSALVGTWQGRGKGEYPTIDPFEYRESLSITPRSDHPALMYDQRTWRRTGAGEVVSHWETGLIRISSDGSVTLHNAQPGRVEVMSGTWERSGDGWALHLLSSGYGGDDRVVASSRTVHLTPPTLSYQMSMETTATGEMSHHISADLMLLIG